jgi:regulator of sigma E protease
MITTLFYVILAIISLTFLIFIHELGHYWMARRVGMRVETFSIGFGRPIYQWVRDGVKWQIGWLLGGGFVKIAGMEAEEGSDPYEVKDGFFGKSPLNRIKVLFMGPFVNIVFAFLAFAALWGLGGRTKNFADYTHKIGWVDPHSELFQLGVRPGDEISGYGTHPYQGAGDNLYAPMTSGEHLVVHGFKVNYATHEKTPFTYTVKPYPYPGAGDKGILTSGILQPANYVIYNRYPNGKENPLPEGSPLIGSGIEYGDALVWVDGELIFSQQQLHDLINSEKALLTIRRDDETLLRRVPRIKVQELKLSSNYKEEMVDWQFEAHLNNIRFPTLNVLPYVLNDYNMVDNRAKFIDPELDAKLFPKNPHSELDDPLQPGDRIIAIDGMEVKHPYQLLDLLQEKHLNIIVERKPEAIKKISWTGADQNFDENLNLGAIQAIAATIGTDHPIKEEGNYYLLKPVAPKRMSAFAATHAELQERKKEIESIVEPERRAKAMQQLEKQEKQLLIGLPGIQDRQVNYNPGPFVLFSEVFQQIWRMLSALVTGSLSPKWMSGPVGIVSAVQEQSRTSLKEMLFWLGAISLNLGVINLIPMPPFDGGGIAIALSEMVTGRRMKAKTMEKLVYPFAILLIIFFLFITYHDVSRIFGRYFK